MAAKNGCSPAEFALEMGLSMKLIWEPETEHFVRLCQLAGLSELERSELSSWSGVKIENVKTHFRNEVFSSRSLRNPTIKGCPACLRQDANDHPSPFATMYIRGDWQIRENDICIQHKKQLVPLWTQPNLVTRNSIGDRLQEIMTDIMSGAIDGQSCEPSEFDFWLQ